MIKKSNQTRKGFVPDNQCETIDAGVDNAPFIAAQKTLSTISSVMIILKVVCAIKMHNENIETARENNFAEEKFRF